MGEGAITSDLGAEGGRAVLVAECSEGAIIFFLRQMGDSGGLKEPGGAVVRFVVAGEASEPGGT